MSEVWAASLAPLWLSEVLGKLSLASGSTKEQSGSRDSWYNFRLSPSQKAEKLVKDQWYAEKTQTNTRGRSQWTRRSDLGDISALEAGKCRELRPHSVAYLAGWITRRTWDINLKRASHVRLAPAKRQ